MDPETDLFATSYSEHRPGRVTVVIYDAGRGVVGGVTAGRPAVDGEGVELVLVDAAALTVVAVGTIAAIGVPSGRADQTARRQAADSDFGVVPVNSAYVDQAEVPVAV